MGLTKAERRKRISKRIRKVVKGTTDKPRLAVYRSNKEIYAQLIDDLSGTTLASASTLNAKLKGSKMDQAKEVGKLIAGAAMKKGIKEICFDRGGFLYHGRIKSLAEGAREAGVQF
ncbi:MAG: 50S ribosomal protein L18 [Flavobacteriales bacterium]|nr:50S ribosomal protein L18 [Flavobacteriales bacterium]